MAVKLNLVYAMRGNDLVHISDVERGIKCGCKCPACDGVLVAKQGEKKTHHFAHYAGENCAYGYETSLHLAAKDILLRAGRLELPESNILLCGIMRETLWTDGGEIIIDSVELEKKTGGVIPDVIVHSGDKMMFVEIYVTHAIDEKKLKKLRKLKIPTLEINLSSTDDSISKDELENIILHGGLQYRYWAYDPLAEEYLKKSYAASHKLWVDWNRTVFCPVKQCRVSDCICSECEDNYGLDEKTFVLCGGKEPVNTIKPVEPIHKFEKSVVKLEKPQFVTEVTEVTEISSWDLLIEQAEQTKQKQTYENDITLPKFIPEKKQPKQVDWEKLKTKQTIYRTKNILTKAGHIHLPRLSDVTINGVDFDNGLTDVVLHTNNGDIALIFYFGRYDDIELPGTYPVLGIDLSISHSCVTVKQFEDILLHDITIKHWLKFLTV